MLSDLSRQKGRSPISGARLNGTAKAVPLQTDLVQVKKSFHSPDVSTSNNFLAGSAFAAVLADSVNLECMPGGIKAMLARNVFLKLACFRGKELHGRSTVCTYHVMVAATIELVLVTRHAIMKCHLAGQPAFGQQLERAIHGGKADLGVLLPHQPKKLVSGKMVAGIQEGAQDGVSLLGMLQPHALEVLEENFLGFTHGFPRGWRMIVNSLLQHR
jgi:hypothetical protein